MSDHSDGSHRRDRHKRHKNRDGRNTSAGSATPRQPLNPQRSGQQPRRDARQEMPPLPKLPTPVCPRCGQAIADISSAISDKTSGEPIHFDCALAFLQGAETLADGEKIVYIGQGKFAVVFFENPADTRKFKIIRVLEWEGREGRPEWRTDISSIFSQVR